ncbi:MAG: pyruvate ferredoxin oxidoreductase [Spirochaetia bacterium]|nr:pyruvate ferredoxin oxidoreductase [Spirochaetia bacterium]
MSNIAQKQEKIAVSGDEAAAYAMKVIEPDVVAAYPITPQTEIVMNFSQFVADGEVTTEMIPVESEHSAMSACVGSAASGARTMTATSANGLALMWEVLYIASSTRLPIVMPVVNRALSAPINIHCDHSDSMGARDAGWIQMYCENAQEVYEKLILAIRIGELEDVRLPVMVCQDGFITSHAVEALEPFAKEDVQKFIGSYSVPYSLLDVDNPVTFGPLDLQDYYFEHKRQQSEAMSRAYQQIPEIVKEFKNTFGSEYDFLELYRMEDAETAVIALGSTAGTAKNTIDGLREQGRKVGLVKMNFVRPFPAEELRSALSPLKAVGILDRAESFSNQGGPLFSEIRAAMYSSGQRPPIADYIYGLGGRDMTPGLIEEVFRDLDKVAKTGKVEQSVHYIGVR